MINQDNLEKRYERIYQQLQELLPKTNSKIARMATAAALLHHKMPHFLWTGFYVLSETQLIIGPYQGSLACQILEKNEGVCWTSIKKKKTISVPDVHKFPGHIVCDSRSNSEIVVPLLDKNNRAWGVLDIDSQKLDAFSETDKKFLEKIVKLI
jgi:GAF domain-containing protein